MRRSYVHSSEHRNPDEDYHLYVSKLEKAPSAAEDGYRYQNNIHLIFKNKPAYEDPRRDQVHVRFEDESHGREGPFVQTEERVHVKEGHRGGRKVHEVVEEEEDINTAAGDFIMRKHKMYETKQMSMRA